MSPTTRRDTLLAAAHHFCDSFATQKPLDDVLAHFSEDAVCLEHGLQRLAPFLGREFSGTNGTKEYFTLIADLLSYEHMQFTEYIVDTDTSKVSVRGYAKFTWKSTGNSWDEVFTYRLAFNDQLKVARYEVWADSGAAYLASKGQLD